MPNSISSSTTSFHVRKRSEEFALQQATLSPLLPPPSIYTSSPIHSCAASSIQALPSTKSARPLQVVSTETMEPLLKKLETLKQIDQSLLKPLDVLFLEIMKIMEVESGSAIKTREKLLSAQKEWQHSLEEQMLSSSEKSRNAQNVSHFFTKLSHALGPLSVVIAGVISCATGGVGIVALGAAALGALFFIDCLFDDVAKKSLASLLARGEREEQEMWLQRIQLVSSVLSMCLNMGTSIPQALQIATVVSETALEGIQAGCNASRDSAKARLIELKGSFEISKNSSDELLQQWEKIMTGIWERYELFQNVQKARSETTRLIIQNM